MKDRQLQALGPAASRSPGEGFTGKVDALFRRYSPNYLPDKAERDAWEADTAGVRSFDREEIVEVYRESRIPAERVAWLIRYRIRRSRDRWRDGTLYDYQDHLLPEPGMLGRFRAGTAIAIAGCVVAIAVRRTSPITDVLSAIAGVLSGVPAWRYWRRIVVEDRRHAADTAEVTQRKAEIEVEFARWTERLKDRPSDAEMETWLDHDRTVLLARAMDHYKLARRQVITHAFLEEPGSRAKHARLRNGPMRYSRYKLIVFVLTSDGVRQMSADLGFVTVTLRLGDRISYRYDAVASAHVSLTRSGPPKPRIQQKFTLTLVNGDPISVIVTDLDPEDIQQGEDEYSLSEATLDAASVTNTLHLLEALLPKARAGSRSGTQAKDSSTEVCGRSPCSADAGDERPGAGRRAAGDRRAAARAGLA
jgi:hypothetical protein